MNRKKLEVSLGLLTMLVAFFAWLSVRTAVIVPDSSTWVVPMILFSAYLILICLDVIVFKNILLLELFLLGSLALSLIFAFYWLQLLAILLSGYFLFLASRRIREDVELSVKIVPWKSLHAGKSYLVFAMALAICMQYFLTIKSFDGEKKVPHFDTSFIVKKIAIPFLSNVNPQFKALKDETLTVDQYILQMQNSSQDDNAFILEEEMFNAQLPANLTQAQKELIKSQARENFSNTQSQIMKKNQELILKVGRKQLSDTLGIEVNGDEKISELLIGPISAKMSDYFNPNVIGEQKYSAFSMILAIVLFLIIWPVGLVLCMPVFLFAKFIFAMLRRLNMVKVVMISVMKEEME